MPIEAEMPNADRMRRIGRRVTSRQIMRGTGPSHDVTPSCSRNDRRYLWEPGLHGLGRRHVGYAAHRDPGPNTAEIRLTSTANAMALGDSWYSASGKRKNWSVYIAIRN